MLSRKRLTVPLSMLTQRSVGRRLFNRALAALLAFVLATWLTACGDVREEVTIRPGERWKAELHMVVSPDEMVFVGGPAEIEAQLEAAGNDPEAAATNYKWSKEPSDDGGAVYTVEQSGRGWQSLNSAAFDDLATFAPMIVDDRDAVRFQFNPAATFGQLGYYELVLHTGEVLETNGELLDEGVVRWVGAYQTMDAIFRPSKGIDPLLIAGLAVLVAGTIAAIMFFRNRQRQQNVQAIMATSAYCYQCGARMETAGRFCPSCGAPRL